jgi:hypothetical protein
MLLAGETLVTSVIVMGKKTRVPKMRKRKTRLRMRLRMRMEMSPLPSGSRLR